MTVTSYTFDGAVLGSGLTQQGTAVPAGAQRRIISASLVNTTGGGIPATVNLAPSGGAGTSNILISARTIAPGETYPCPELINQSMNAGGGVFALGNGLSFKYAAVDIF